MLCFPYTHITSHHITALHCTALHETQPGQYSTVQYSAMQFTHSVDVKYNIKLRQSREFTIPTHTHTHTSNKLVTKHVKLETLVMHTCNAYMYM